MAIFQEDRWLSLHEGFNEKTRLEQKSQIELVATSKEKIGNPVYPLAYCKMVE